jgi:OmpA-OmpF porin, OOP family
MPVSGLGVKPRCAQRLPENPTSKESTMRCSRTITAWVGAIILSLVLVPLAEAQIMDRLRDRARQQVEERLGEAEDPGAEAETAPGTTDGMPETQNPGEGLWVNYDFVPGSRVIWAEDFTTDRVGNFPQRIELLRGNFEVAEWRAERWLRTTGDGRIAIELPEALPQRFTIEFDYNSGGRGPGRIYFTDDERGRPHVLFYYYRGGIAGAGVDAVGRLPSSERNRVIPVRIMADGNYVKVYHGETRVANAPNADLGRSNRLVFAILASTSNPVMLGNVRIAAGGRALYDALSGDGRVAVRGILFDTGSERIRPESTPTLTEIGEMLRQHADLRLRIEGHTDNVGDAAANAALSERRAEAVLRYLSDRHGIDASRLEAVGLGQSEPADSNETPEGRQNNRRVELVRL